MYRYVCIDSYTQRRGHYVQTVLQRNWPLRLFHATYAKGTFVIVMERTSESRILRKESTKTVASPVFIIGNKMISKFRRINTVIQLIIKSHLDEYIWLEFLVLNFFCGDQLTPDMGPWIYGMEWAWDVMRTISTSTGRSCPHDHINHVYNVDDMNQNLILIPCHIQKS